MNGDPACRLGVDVGGTFTDLVLVTQDGRVVTRKVLSTSSNYAEAIFGGIAEVMQDGGVAGGDVKELIHGTTVATNAIIERRGARTGLVTTEGFRDLLEIGRLRLMRLYDMDQGDARGTAGARLRRTVWGQCQGADLWRPRRAAGVAQDRGLDGVHCLGGRRQLGRRRRSTPPRSTRSSAWCASWRWNWRPTSGSMASPPAAR